MCNSRYRRLTSLYRAAKKDPIKLKQGSKYVIIGDQHMGCRQFDQNRELYCRVLEYYFRKNFDLILLGDVEELNVIRFAKFKELYGENAYRWEGKFIRSHDHKYFRMWGNHDIDWANPDKIRSHLKTLLPDLPPPSVKPCLVFQYGDQSLHVFVTHGHQGEWHGEKLAFMGKVLSPFARLLGIKRRRSVSQNHRRRFPTEKQYYRWASNANVVLLTGHTHRPRFESMDKLDRLEISIELTARKYAREDDPQTKQVLWERHGRLIEEYEKARKKHHETKKRKRLGEGDLVVPCYFNAGSCLHEKGMTCFELTDKFIRLIFYLDRELAACKAEIPRPDDEYLSYLLGEAPAQQRFLRRVLENETLDYIACRMQPRVSS